MIRFACPSCNSVFTVGDEKAGKTGKCPKCQAQFVIPDVEPGTEAASPPPPVAPPPPPATDANEVEIKPCPGCQSKLVVGRDDLGLDVECPYCKTVYKAEAPGGSSVSKKLSKRTDDEDDNRPRKSSRRRDDDEDDDDKPRKDRFGEDRDDDEDDRPRKRKRRKSGNDGLSDNPALGIVSLVTGILALPMGCCCGLFSLPLSLTAIITGSIGIKTQRSKGMAIAGLILGIISVLLFVIMLILAASGAFKDIIEQNNRRFGR